RRQGLLPGEPGGRGPADQARARRVQAGEALRQSRLRLRLVAPLHVQPEGARPGRGRRARPPGAVGQEVAAVSVAYTWGSEEAERRLPFPCDGYVPHPDAAYFRAVTVRATPERLFRWLCQLRAAPYSYDWIDNWGRRSPRTLTPGLERLAIGQGMMRAFTVVDFARDRHVTLRVKHATGAYGLFGDVAVTYPIPTPSRERS